MNRDAATQRQVDAADPLNSTWLSANAGSGKTRVLTDRVARLLLEGVQPQNILCLTYTKAAAAEMQNRLFKRLGSWAMLSDAKLRADLVNLGVEGQIDAQRLRDSRTLFARAIETPGGLKIQTIHSFCAAILRRFPLEAQVSPRFREMEDRQTLMLRMEVLDTLSQGVHRDVVRDLLDHFTGAEINSLVGEITGKRGLFRAPLDEGKLRRTLRLDAMATTQDAFAQILNDDTKKTISDAIKVLRTGSINDNKAADKLAKVNLKNPTAADLDLLEDTLLYGANSIAPFGPRIGKIPTKALSSAHPELTEDLNELMEVVANWRDPRKALAVLDRTRALYAFAGAFVAEYERRKLALGLLDFDDLIAKARDLLTDRLVSEWVLFRLDGGVDHVLVDEAQDTSPTQWAVIEHLTKELVSGLGARSDAPRTIFVVGDKKQSIYSFQGADPDEFDRMRSYFSDNLAATQKRLENMVLQHSFRSSGAILRVVDDTFFGDRAEGLDKQVYHQAFKDQMPGRVDLWPVIEKSEKTPDFDWTEPVDAVSDTHHDVQLANRIATQIKRMITHETLPHEIDHTGTYNHRKITEGDFLILVQRRSDLFSEIIRACKQHGLEVAGADRLRITAELAVNDMTALLSFLALPEDDLSLAAALRSPLFGWSEKQLYALAQPRPDKSFLWQALRTHPDHPETLAIIGDLLKQADFLRPYDLIERILTRHDGRRRLLARLGSEAEDGIDALLSLALSYEQNGVPSLTGFLSWLNAEEVEIKRQMDAQGDRIRVMTVHGAKGLEAPIVILPDCAKREIRVNSEIFEADGQAIWKPLSAAQPTQVAQLQDEIKAAQTRERMRLLYVAMTRAEKWLIVAAAGDVGEGDASWYNIAADGIERSGAVDQPLDDMVIRRVQALDWQPGVRDDPAPVVQRTAPAPVFDALPDLTRSKTLSPSDLGGAKILPGDPAGGDEEDARQRGTAMHLLLEHLPALAPQARAETARRLLATLPAFRDPATGAALIKAALGIISTPALSHLFGPGPLAEVDITAALPELGGQRIHGTIDRLVIGDERVLAVDYKTNRVIPDRPEDTPEGVLRQQGAYAAALRQIYPNHRIETAILWTETAWLMPLPTPIVAAALARVTTS